MITIPRTFKLGGRDWTVEFHDVLDGDPDVYGDTDANDCVIRLKKGLRPDTLNHTFYHELCHAIAGTLGWKNLNQNEDKIDSLAGMLYQYLKTKRGTCQE